MKNLNPDLSEAEFLALATWAQQERKRQIAQGFADTAQPTKSEARAVNRGAVARFDGAVKRIPTGRAAHSQDLNQKRAGAMSMGFYRAGGTC